MRNYLEETSSGERVRALVLVSADAEWRAVLELYPKQDVLHTPYGEWFLRQVMVGDDPLALVFFQGGWGKIAAASSTQYAVDRWKPELLVNLGTCGGIAGYVERGAVREAALHQIARSKLDLGANRVTDLAHGATHGLEKGNDNASDFTPKCTMPRSNSIATLRRL